MLGKLKLDPERVVLVLSNKGDDEDDEESCAEGVFAAFARFARRCLRVSVGGGMVWIWDECVRWSVDEGMPTPTPTPFSVVDVSKSEQRQKKKSRSFFILPNKKIQKKKKYNFVPDFRNPQSESVNIT